MRRILLFLFVIAISLLSFAQIQTVEPLRQQQPPIEQTSESFWYVSQDFKGSVTQLEEFMKVFMKGFFDQKLIPMGQPVALFYNAPKDAKDKEVKMEIGFPVSEKTKVQPPLKMRQLKIPMAFKLVHVGPYEKIFGEYEKLDNHIRQQNLKAKNGPTIHRFLNNPAMVKPEEIKTEILVPVAGKIPPRQPQLKLTNNIQYIVVTQEFQGSVEQVGEFMKAFMKEFFAQQLVPTGQPMGIFYGSPKDARDKTFKMELGFPVARQVDVKKPLKIQELKLKRAAGFLYTGPYEKLFGAYDETMKTLRGKKLFQLKGGPTVHIFLNNPEMVKPEEIKTEILIPITEQQWVFRGMSNDEAGGYDRVYALETLLLQEVSMITFKSQFGSTSVLGVQKIALTPGASSTCGGGNCCCSSCCSW